MYSVNDLLSTLGNGSRASNFAVSIPIPSVLKAADAVNHFLNSIPIVNSVLAGTGNMGASNVPNDSTIKILAKSSSIPGRSVSVIDVFDRGRKYKVRGEAEFSGRWTCTFYNTSDMALHGLFYDWMQKMDDVSSSALRTVFPVNNMGLASKPFSALNPGYMSDMRISVLDCDGNDSAVYELVHAFPCEINEVSLDASQPNTITEFQVTFCYSYSHRVFGQDVNGSSTVGGGIVQSLLGGLL